MDLNGIWKVFERRKDGTIERLTPSTGRYYLSCIRPDGISGWMPIVRYEKSTGEITPLSNDNVGHTHGLGRP